MVLIRGGQDSGPLTGTTIVATYQDFPSSVGNGGLGGTWSITIGSSGGGDATQTFRAFAVCATNGASSTTGATGPAGT
jgi:hypothetical protein